MSDAPSDPSATTRSGRGMAIVAALLVIAVLVVIFEPTGVIRGRLLGESLVAGYPASYWARQLQRGPAERSEARAALQQAGQDAVEVLTELLTSHDSAEVRWTAAEILGALGPDANAASDALIAALHDPDPYVQSIAAEVLPEVGTPADQAIPALLPLLGGEHAHIAARSISAYKAQAAPAIPDLLAVLTDTSRETDARWNAARAIGKIGPPALEALPVLIASTTDAEATVRGNAAEAIGDIGPTAADGIPALVQALEDPEPRVRHHAVRSLAYIGPAATEAVPAIRPLLKDPEASVSTEAAKAIEAIAPPDQASRPDPVELKTPE